MRERLHAMKAVTGTVVAGIRGDAACAPARRRRRVLIRRHRRLHRRPRPTSNSKRLRSATCARLRNNHRSAPRRLAITASTIALDDVSAAGWQARLTFTELYLAALEAHRSRAKLSRANQVDALLLLHDLQFDRWKYQTLAGLALEPAALHAHRR